jgi:hypothetical protein
MTRQRAHGADKGPIAKGELSAFQAERLDLSVPTDLRLLVCAGFCTHHKPGVVEEWHCGGLGLVAALRGRAVDRGPEAVASFDRALRDAVVSDERVGFAADTLLKGAICATCAFLPDEGCDHRNPDLAEDDRLEPCGGYLLLTLLLRRGVLDPVRVEAVGGSGEVEEPGDHAAAGR